MASTGVVREFRPAEGWGVVDGPDVPGGCWLHFSVIVMEGFRQLVVGQRVYFDAEAGNQDGYNFRAVKVWLDAVEPADAAVRRLSSSVVYHSSLTLTFDEPADSES
jgi:CspA family cold shock protein